MSSVESGQFGQPTDGTAEQQVEIAATTPADALLDQSKRMKLPEDVPPVHTEGDKWEEEKKKIGDENLSEAPDEPKKVFIFVFLIY